MNDIPSKKGKDKRRPRDSGALRRIREGMYVGRASRINIEGERERAVFRGSRQEVLDQMAVWRKTPKQKPSAPITVREYLACWLAEVKASNRHATYALREVIIRRHIAPYIGDLRLGALERDHIRGWLDALAEARAGARTRQVALATLTCALNAAIESDRIAANPCERIGKRDRPCAIEHPKVILSIEEAHQLLEVAREGPYYALFLLALRTGMRQGELFALEWADIDLDRAELHVEKTLTEDEHGQLVRTDPKIKTSRRKVALSPQTVVALREHRKRTAGFSGLVFTSRDGTPIRKTNFIRRHFHPLLKRAGLPHVTFHSLRHLSNSVVLANGASALEAAERIGHSDTRVTLDRYGHVLGNAQRALADRLDAMFEPR